MDPDTSPGVLDPGLAGQSWRPVDGVDNGFLAGYRVRFDEAGVDGRMRASALLRYAQDIAWRHSEHLGFDRDWYRDRGLNWVVRGVELDLHADVPMGHTLRLATAIVGHRRIWARRLAEARLADGRLAARITTDWVLIDGRNRIVRIPADFGVAFPNPEIDAEILRVPVPDRPPSHSVALGVRPRDLDPFGHVNNAVYVDWLDEALEAAGWRSPPQAGDIEAWRVEYVASAARGDQVTVDLHGGADAWRGRIHRSDGLELVRAAGGSGPTPERGGTRGASG